MTVTVDRELLAVKALGLRTVGQVLNHLQKDNRLVVHLLIDGQEPAPQQLGELRRAPLEGRTLYIETADPRELAGQVLDEVAYQVEQAEPLKQEAADLLQRNQLARAMEKLAGCLRAWHNAQDAIGKTAELLRLDAGAVRVDGMPLQQVLAGFADTLRAIKSALEQRDFVLLGDLLMYETADAQRQWLAAVRAMRRMVG